MESNTRDHGVAYWHVEHQLPGVFICPWHCCALQLASDKVSGQNRHGWVLPRQARLMSLSASTAHHLGDLQFAEFASALWSLPLSFTFTLDRLGKLYRRKLVEDGFIHTVSSRVDHRRFEQSLQKLLSISSMPIVWPWLASSDHLHSFSRRLLRMAHPTSPRWSRQPLNHLPLMVLLFDSWISFWNAYQLKDFGEGSSSDVDTAPTPPVPCDAVNKNESPRSVVIEMIRSGQTVSQAAKLALVSVATAMTWAANEGIQTPRRPKVLKVAARSNLIQKLKCGIGKAEAASLAGITVQSVTRLLFTEPGLHDQWEAARFLNAQKDARESWQAIQVAFPENSSNEWRRLDPAAYAWLYRNDRAWLKSSIQERPRPPATSPQRRDWEGRDATLAQAVRIAVLGRQLSHPSKPPTIGDICAVVSGLRQKLSVLHKLPLTRQSIREACTDNCHAEVAPPLQMELPDDASGSDRM